MPEYKLTYFDLGAVAEPIRLLLKAANVPFEDERIALADWEQNKPRFPVGQVPILAVDGKELTQSYAIIRYLAKQHGFATSDDFLNYRSDQVVQIVEDARITARPLILEVLLGKNDPKVVEDLQTKLRETEIPRYLKQLESIVAETEGSFIAGNQVTHGDFILANWLNIWERIVDEKLLDNFPVLRKQKDAIEALPGVREWLETRPKTYI